MREKIEPLITEAAVEQFEAGDRVLYGRNYDWDVGAGLVVVNRTGVELDSFHALYGFSTIIAVGILYSYRGSPFVKDKVHLLYGVGSLFIMGLGIRAMFLGTN